MPFDKSDNTPPRSPDAGDDLASLNEDEMAEVIYLEEGAEWAMDAESVVEDENEEGDTDLEDGPFTPDRDDAVVRFDKHGEPVLASVFHPTKGNIAVTGSMDNSVFVWEFSSEASVLSESKHAKESVDCVKFSKDGKYLVTVDLDSNINVFSGDTFEHIRSIEINDDFQWLEWHPVANIFVIGTWQNVVMYSVPKFEEKYISMSNTNRHWSGCFLPDGKRFVVFSACLTMQVFDLKTCTVIKTVKPFHELEEVTKLDTHKDVNAILCGCINGLVFIANPDTGKCVAMPDTAGDSECVEAVAYSKIGGPQILAATGHGRGALRIWDTTRQSLRHQKKFEGGITGLLWHPTKLIVFTCHTNGVAAMFDARSGSVLREFMGHTRQCLSLDFNMNSCRGAVLMTTSDDQTARVYLVEGEGEPSTSST